MPVNVARVLLKQEEIPDCVWGVAGEVYGLLDDTVPVVVLGILKGALFFLADFVPILAKLHPDVTYECIGASSYRDGTTPEERVEVVWDLEAYKAVRGKQVVVVDDIIDTGATMTAVVRHLCALGPRTIIPCALLAKKGAVALDAPVERVGDVKVYPPHVGLLVELEPNEFVLGYGMGLGEKHRADLFVYTTTVEARSEQ